VDGVKKKKQRPSMFIGIDGVPVESFGFPACWTGCLMLLRNDSHYTPNTPRPGMAMRALTILAMAVDLACMASVPGDTLIKLSGRSPDST